MVVFENARIIYPDYLGTGPYNTYKRNLFHIIVDPQEAELMASSGIKIRMTKPSNNYPDPEPYVEVVMGYKFLSDGEEILSENPPVITLRNLADLSTLEVTYENLDILMSCRLANVTLTVSQSTPKVSPRDGVLRSRFYLRSMTADIGPYYNQT